MWLLVWVWVQYTVRDWTEFWVPLAQTFKRQNNSYFEEDLYDRSGGPCSLKLAYTPCTSRTTCPQKNWELTFELKKKYMHHRHPHKPPLAPSQVTYYLQDPFSHSQILQCSGPSVWPAAQLHTVLNATVLSHGPAFFPLLQPSYLWGQSLQCSPHPLELSPI